MPTTGADQQEIAEGATWEYQTKVHISSLTLRGTVTITYQGAVEKDVEGQNYLLDLYEWEGSLDITGFYSAGIPNGTATYRGHQYVEMNTGYDVFSDMNMSLNFTTCLGSLDEVRHSHWHHYTVSFLPPGGTGNEPDIKNVGTNWTKTFTVHMISRGTFYWGELLNIDVTENRTYSYSVDDFGQISVPAGEFDCTSIRSAYEDDVFAEWCSDGVGRPVKILKEYDDVRVYHSGEDWNMTLESYDLESSNQANLIAGVGGLVGAAVILMAIFVLVRWKIGKTQRR